MDLEKLSNIFGAEIIKKVYDDTLSPGAQEVGQAVKDVIKGLRLFTAPFQLLGNLQERLVKHLNEVRDSVPEELQIPARPAIAGPVMERLKYLEDDSYLAKMYKELLSRAINKERISEAHPAFIHIIDQLSPDEAIILKQLHGSKRGLMEYVTWEGNWKPVKTGTIAALDISQLIFPGNVYMYLNHLASLSLVNTTTDIRTNDNIAEDPFYLSETITKQTEFGRLFVNVCIPATTLP